MVTGSFDDSLIEGLPGETLVRQGVADLRSRRRTIAACAVEIARDRLGRAGIRWESTGPAMLEPEFELYELLRREGGDPYSRYNAIVRELVSFESALSGRAARRGA
jgi:hypothetical protein